MSVTPHASAATRTPMDPMRRTSLLAGVLYLLTFVSIPTLALYKPVKDHVDTFVLGAGSETGVLWAALSEIVVGLAGIGTAVVLYPVLKRQSQTAALGVVVARLLETALILVGVSSMLSILALRSDVAGTAGADPASLGTTGHALVAVYTSTFLISQSLMPVIVDLLLGYLLYRSGLVPRILPLIAFGAAPLLLLSDFAVYFGAYSNVSGLALVGALPIAVFEFSLGVYLVVKGFKPSSSLMTQPNTAVRVPVPVPAPRAGDRDVDPLAADVS
jgi:uncharacterized protein DUF4386